MTAERQTQEFQLEITDDARTALQQATTFDQVRELIVEHNVTIVGGMGFNDARTVQAMLLTLEAYIREKTSEIPRQTSDLEPTDIERIISNSIVSTVTEGYDAEAEEPLTELAALIKPAIEATIQQTFAGSRSEQSLVDPEIPVETVIRILSDILQTIDGFPAEQTLASLTGFAVAMQNFADDQMLEFDIPGAPRGVIVFAELRQVIQALIDNPLEFVDPPQSGKPPKLQFRTSDELIHLLETRTSELAPNCSLGFLWPLVAKGVVADIDKKIRQDYQGYGVVQNELTGLFGIAKIEL